MNCFECRQQFAHLPPHKWSADVPEHLLDCSPCDRTLLEYAQMFRDFLGKGHKKKTKVLQKTLLEHVASCVFCATLEAERRELFARVLDDTLTLLIWYLAAESKEMFTVRQVADRVTERLHVGLIIH